jgi:hypothetical protein
MTIFGDLEELSTSSVAVSHAKPFQLLESEKDSQIRLEERSFLILQEQQMKSDLNICSLKTLEGYSTTIEGKRSEQSFKRWMNWGMTLNGNCATANISEYHKTGNECLLSDILETEVDEKYFLSEDATKKLLNYKDNKYSQIQSEQDTEMVQADRMLVNVNSRKS